MGRGAPTHERALYGHAGALAGHPQAPQPMIENGTEQHRRWPRFAAATMSRFRVRGSGNDLLTVVKAGEASRC
jgi:hypothetical protein